MGSPPSVEAWLTAQDASTRAMIEALRAVVRAAHPDLGEAIKWNAPSFTDAGEDRVTLGVEQRGGVRMVLHRGTRTTDRTFRFVDLAGVARWPSADRGVVVFRALTEIGPLRPALEDLVRRWIVANRERDSIARH